MNAIIRSILFYAALILYGCLCGFFIVLNYIKDRIEREDNDEIKDKTI
jgi:uncharacterized protein YneF (UPF0154 family)